MASKHKKYFLVGNDVIMLHSEMSFGASEGVKQLREKYPDRKVVPISKKRMEELKKENE
jgi:hypothetical protein